MLEALLTKMSSSSKRIFQMNRVSRIISILNVALTTRMVARTASCRRRAGTRRANTMRRRMVIRFRSLCQWCQILMLYRMHMRCNNNAKPISIKASKCNFKTSTTSQPIQETYSTTTSTSPCTYRKRKTSWSTTTTCNSSTRTSQIIWQTQETT